MVTDLSVNLAIKRYYSGKNIIFKIIQNVFWLYSHFNQIAKYKLYLTLKELAQSNIGHIRAQHS